MKEKWEQNLYLDDHNIRKCMNIKMHLEKIKIDQEDGKSIAIYKCECGKKFKIGEQYYLPTCFFAGCNYCSHVPVKEQRLYRIWSGMKNRCYNSNSSDYQFYGGKGIKLCESWLKYRVFEAWALSHGYADGMTVERVDINGNYSPRNCKWISMNEQSKNRSTTYQNRFFTYDNETLNFYQWADRLGVTPQEIGKRIRKYGQNSQYVISPPAMLCDNPIIDLNGESKTLREWLKCYGIRRSTYDYRISIGMTPVQALTHKKYSRTV